MNHITACSTFLLEDLTVSHVCNKVPALYGTRMFTIAFTKVPPLFSPSSTRSVYCTSSQQISLRFTLILSCHLRLGLPRGPFPSVPAIKRLYAHLLSSIHATCPAHLIVLDLITGIIFSEQYISAGGLG